MKQFRITANAVEMGVYHADTAEQALDAYAMDAGYASYAEVIDQCGDDAVAQEFGV
jgi:hypothetical protein